MRAAGRKDRRSASRAIPPEGAERDRATDERRYRALRELLDVREDPRAPAPAVQVGNPIHATHYRVYLPGYPALEPAACGCADYAHRGLGTCKHVEAARRWLSGHPGAVAIPHRSHGDAEAERLWRGIDDRIARKTDRRPASQRWRHAGALLYEEGFST